MEIIQLVAINVHDKAQHIVDQSRKPCAFIPQQVEDFRHFALGLRTDIDRRTVTAIHRREERAFESGSAIFLRQNPADSCPVVWMSTSVFSAVGADAPDTFPMCFPQERPYLPLPVRESGGRLSNPKGPVGDHLTHQPPRRLRYGMFRRIGCRFVCFFQ